MKSLNNTLTSEGVPSVLPYGMNQTGTMLALSDLLSHNLRIDQIGELKGNNPTIPINDLRGNEAAMYGKEERQLRCKLASLYRLVDINGWTQSIYNHISVRVGTSEDRFLINPFGLLYHEVQASSLVEIDSNGKILDPGSSILGINRAGWNLHAALHVTRKDINCIVHVHLPDCIAVSCMRAGLLAISPEGQELISKAGVRYHDYQGILVDEAERKSLQTDLGEEAKVLFLRNHGVVVAASSIPEAWYLLKRVVSACQTQMRLMQLGTGSALLAHFAESAMRESKPFQLSEVENGGKPNEDAVDQEFEAQMRLLDSAGYRTGHVYLQPNLLRRGHFGPNNSGLDSTMWSTGADFFTTDFTSAGELSGNDDMVSSATAAGRKQKAKIMESVRASRGNKSSVSQRNGVTTASTLNGNLSMDTDVTLPMTASSPMVKEGSQFSRTLTLPNNSNRDGYLTVDGLVRSSKTLSYSNGEPVPGAPSVNTDNDESLKSNKGKKDKKQRSFRALFSGSAGKKTKEPLPVN